MAVRAPGSPQVVQAKFNARKIGREFWVKTSYEKETSIETRWTAFSCKDGHLQSNCPYWECHGVLPNLVKKKSGVLSLLLTNKGHFSGNCRRSQAVFCCAAVHAGIRCPVNIAQLKLDSLHGGCLELKRENSQRDQNSHHNSAKVSACPLTTWMYPMRPQKDHTSVNFCVGFCL